MSPLPSVTFRSELPPVVRKELDQFDGELTGYLLEEHDDDGHHTHITADSLILDGPLDVNGPLSVTGPLDVSGPVSITGPLAVNGAVSVTGPLTVTGHANITGGLSVGQDISAGGNIYEMGRSVPMGWWITVPFSAADFTGGGGMTWIVEAGDIAANDYTLIGKTLIWNVVISAATLGGTPATVLNVAIPKGFVIAKPAQVMGQINLGAWEPALVFYSGGAIANIYRVNVSAMPLGNMYLAFQLVLTLA